MKKRQFLVLALILSLSVFSWAGSGKIGTNKNSTVNRGTITEDKVDSFGFSHGELANANTTFRNFLNSRLEAIIGKFGANSDIGLRAAAFEQAEGQNFSAAQLDAATGGLAAQYLHGLYASGDGTIQAASLSDASSTVNNIGNNQVLNNTTYLDHNVIDSVNHIENVLHTSDNIVANDGFFVINGRAGATEMGSGVTFKDTHYSSDLAKAGFNDGMFYQHADSAAGAAAIEAMMSRNQEHYFGHGISFSSQDFRVVVGSNTVSDKTTTQNTANGKTTLGQAHLTSSKTDTVTTSTTTQTDDISSLGNATISTSGGTSVTTLSTSDSTALSLVSGEPLAGTNVSETDTQGTITTYAGAAAITEDTTTTNTTSTTTTNNFVQDRYLHFNETVTDTKVVQNNVVVGVADVGYTPIVLDIEGKGRLEASGGRWLPHPKQVDKNHLMLFDFFGNGFPVVMEWVGPHDGLLVKPKADGSIDGTCFFGTADGYANGFEKLKAFDTDGNGVLEGKELAGLYIWQDKNQNGRVDAGELVSVQALGITAISTQNRDYVGAFTMKGNQHIMWDWCPNVGNAEVYRVKKTNTQ